MFPIFYFLVVGQGQADDFVTMKVWNSLRRKTLSCPFTDLLTWTATCAQSSLPGSSTKYPALEVRDYIATSAVWSQVQSRTAEFTRFTEGPGPFVNLDPEHI